MRKSMKSTLAMLAVLSVCGMGTVWAADAPVYALKGITVTATRQAESLQDVPANVQVITEKDIKSRNVQTASDAVAMATGVSASNSVEGTVNLRGYNSKNILVLVDGQQMNTAWNGDVDWNMIPVDNIRKIEVVSGGQSALYGGRAVGGVINIMTKTQKENGVHGNALVSYGSHNTWKQAYSVSGKKDKVTWGTFYESKQTDGWKDFDAYVAKSSAGKLENKDKLEQTADGGYVIGNRGNKAVLSENYGFNLGYAFNDDQKLTYKYTHAIYTWVYKNPETYIGAWRPKSGSAYSPASFLGTKAWRTSNMHSLTYNDQKNKVHAHIGMVDYTKDGYTTPDKNVDEKNNFDGIGKLSSYPSKSWDFDLNKRWTLGAHTILLGGSYGHDQFEKEVYNVSDWKTWNSLRTGNIEKHGGKDRNYAFYLQDKWAISSKWTAYIGGRYDYYKKYGGYSQLLNKDGSLGELTPFSSESYNKFSPKLSLDYKWDDNTNLYVSYGKSFNSPILYQVYRDGTSGRSGNYIHTKPNASLKPETTDTWELGMKKKVGNKTEIHTDVFYAKTSDTIDLIPTGETETISGIDYTVKKYMNVGDSKTHGFEISINQHHSEAWTSYINYTWQTGKINSLDTNTNQMKEKNNDDIPRHLLHLGTTYNKDAWTVNLDGMFISDRTEEGMKSGHFKARDAYFLLNLNTNYQFTKNFSMQFSIENLLDREYYDEDISSNKYYIGDGRTFTISARYTF